MVDEERVTALVAILLALSAADAARAAALVGRLKVALAAHDVRAARALADPKDGLWLWHTTGLWPEPTRKIPPKGLVPDGQAGPLDEPFFEDLCGRLGDVGQAPPVDRRRPEGTDVGSFEVRGPPDTETVYVFFTTRRGRLYVAHVLLWPYEA